MHAPDPIIQLAQGHIAILIGRNWPAIVELLDESEEVTVSAKILISERTPEDGNHADVDHRVKTTISFSKKVSDSTESALEDPSNAPLTCPHGKTLDEVCQECADEAKAGNVFVPTPEHTNAADEERIGLGLTRDQYRDYLASPDRGIVATIHHPETGDSAAEVREAKAVIDHAAQPIGTSVGAKLDAAAIQQKAPQFVLDLAQDESEANRTELTRAWKKSAKNAGWSAPQISALNDILKATDTVQAMIKTLRPFVIADSPAPAQEPWPTVDVTHGDGSADQYTVPPLYADLPDGFPLEKVLHTFVVAARDAEWPKEAIAAVGNEAERQARVIGDEPEATETATQYLRNFCVSK